MIEVTKLNGMVFHLNPELIEQIESAPDTVITLTTGNNFVVREKIEVVIEKIVEYRQRVSAHRQVKRESFEALPKGAA